MEKSGSKNKQKSKIKSSISGENSLSGNSEALHLLFVDCEIGERKYVSVYTGSCIESVPVNDGDKYEHKFGINVS